MCTHAFFFLKLLISHTFLTLRASAARSHSPRNVDQKASKETGKMKTITNEKTKELICIDEGFLFDMRSLYFTIKLSTHQRDTYTNSWLSRICTDSKERRLLHCTSNVLYTHREYTTRVLHKFTYNYFVLKMTSGQFILLACNFLKWSCVDTFFFSLFIFLLRRLLLVCCFSMLFLFTLMHRASRRIIVPQVLNICRRCKRHHWDA